MLTIPFNKQKCKERLLKEYKTYGSLIIAFDFDNTVFDYHNTGDDYTDIVELLHTCQNIGMTLVLFTVENKIANLQEKIDYLHNIGIYPKYVNDSPIFEGSAKPYYNLLLDDRAGLEEACEILSFVINKIKNEQN